jgi:NDP-sugar pyrophosphorylase family protein
MINRKVNLIPIAGLGLRFKNKGYKIPKPLIPINGTPMFVSAARALPKADLYIFVCLKNYIEKYSLDKIIKNYFPKSKIISLAKKTKGQADTCLKAVNFLKDSDRLTIGSCDYSMKYNSLDFNKKLKSSDLLIWTFKNKDVVNQKVKSLKLHAKKN